MSTQLFLKSADNESEMADALSQTRITSGLSPSQAQSSPLPEAGLGSDQHVTVTSESQVKAPLVERQFTFSSGFGKLDFETTTSLWFSASASLGRINDILGRDLGLDKVLAGRLFLSVGSLYTSWVLTYASHELAHAYTDMNHGGSIGDYSLNLNDWSRLAPGITFDSNDGENQYEYVLDAIHGLHQQEFNAAYQFRQSALRGEFTADEGLAYLFNTIADVAYEGLTYVYGYPTGDVRRYLEDIEQQYKLSYSPKELAAWSVLSVLGSWHAWESVYAFAHTAASGERERYQMFSLELGGAALLPPNFALYPTPVGLFLNTEIPLRAWPNEGALLMLELGKGLGDGASVTRVGLAAEHLKAIAANEWYIPRFDVFAALNFNTVDVEQLMQQERNNQSGFLEYESYGGFGLLGGSPDSYDSEKLFPATSISSNEFGFKCGGALHLGDEFFDVAAHVTYAQNDFLENATKGYRSGMRFLLRGTVDY